jgi:hypothetical protein
MDKRVGDFDWRNGWEIVQGTDMDLEEAMAKFPALIRKEAIVSDHGEEGGQKLGAKLQKKLEIQKRTAHFPRD